jgi:hypothetical protein
MIIKFRYTCTFFLFLFIFLSNVVMKFLVFGVSSEELGMLVGFIHI